MVSPQDTTVRRGSTVLLECRVSLTGSVVQWTRDQFGLGMPEGPDRILPNPRYSIKGSALRGKYEQIKDYLIF